MGVPWVSSGNFVPVSNHEPGTCATCDPVVTACICLPCVQHWCLLTRMNMYSLHTHTHPHTHAPYITLSYLSISICFATVKLQPRQPAMISGRYFNQPWTVATLMWFRSENDRSRQVSTMVQWMLVNNDETWLTSIKHGWSSMIVAMT